MSSTISTDRPVLAHVEHPVFGPAGGHLFSDGRIALFPTMEDARRGLDDAGGAFSISATEGMVIKVAVGDLRPGMRFVTPGGNTLTVVMVRIYWQSARGVEVVTTEPYVPGEWFVADRDYLVEVAR